MCWQPLIYLLTCWQCYSALMVIREQIAEVSLFFLPLCES